MIRRWALLVLIFVGTSLGANSVRAQDSLAKLAPFDVNAVSLVKVRALIDSPYGKKNKWAEQFREAYASGMISAPPYVDEVLRGADVRPSMGENHSSWALYRMRLDTFMDSIAKHEGTKVERAGDAFAVDSPRGIYFVQLAHRVMGAVQPGDRQLASKWVRQVKAGNGVTLSDKLVKSLASDAQVVLSADTTDMLSAVRVAAWLKSLPQAEIGDSAPVAEVLASLEDVIITVHVTDAINAKLQLDFGKSIGTNAKSIGTAIRTWLEDIGAHIETMGDAKIQVTDKTITFESAIDEASFRRILSLVRTPTMAAEVDTAASGTAANPVATKRYYQAVVGYVDDLLRIKKKKAADYNKTATWHETYARKIEDLSVAGVDGDIRQWGYETSKRLKALAGSLRGLPMEIDELERKIRVDFKPWYVRSATTPWGYYYTPEGGTATTNESEIRIKQQEAIDAFAKQRDQVWEMIEKDRAAAVEKYKATSQVDISAK